VDRLVKERLVGAAVLMAAAIILIPEMLSGPDRESPAESAAAQTRSDAPIKTYTIDLNHSPSAQPPPAVIENRAPPPEELPVAQPTAAQPAPDDQAKPEVPPQSATAPQSQPLSQPPPQPVVEQPTVAAPPTRAAQRPLASGGAAPTSGRWAVQVGTFSKEANAERLSKQLRDQGQSSFVMPVKSGGATLYRVRIGPMKDRANAEAALRDVKSSAPGAAIVPHP
jgi:DedD protein